MESGAAETSEASSIGPQPDGEQSTPESVKRCCTDCLFLPIFILAVCMLEFVGSFQRESDMLDHLDSLPDYRGQMCGHGKVADERYLFFCLREGGLLDKRHAVCRHSCPNSSNTTNLCPSLSRGKASEVLHDYPTTLYLGMLCKPNDRALKEQLRRWVDQRSVIAYLNMVRRNYPPLIASAGVAVVLSFAYIALLGRFGGYLVWGGIFVLVGVPLACAGHDLVYCVQLQGAGCARDEAAQRGYVINGMLFLGVGLFCLYFACKIGDSIDRAIELIEWSCSCITSTPIMLLAPLCTLGLRMLIVVLMRRHIVRLVSCYYIDVLHPDPTTASPGELLFSSSFLFMFYWLQQTVSALTDFSTAYSTAVWYFRGGLRNAGRAPVLVLGQAYLVAVRYHAGTLVMGGLLVGTAESLQPLVGRCTTKLERFAARAYCEVALNSLPFMPATRTAQAVLKGKHTQRVLDGAERVFKVAGVGGIACAGYALTRLLIIEDPAFSQNSSMHYVFDPLADSAVGGLVAAAVALPFMNLFDTVGDSINYCIAVERQRSRPAQQEDTWVESFVGYTRHRLGCYCGFRPRLPQNARGQSPGEGRAMRTPF